MSKEEKLYKIVKTWEIHLSPEYRGFRCALCQRYIHKAWHYLLSNKYFKTPVHLCRKCQRQFDNDSSKPTYKMFTCDLCNRNMFKAFHVWTKKHDTLIETHFCKKCFTRSSHNEPN